MDLIRYILNGVARRFSSAHVTLLMTESAAAHPNSRQVASDFSHLVTLQTIPDNHDRHRLIGMISAFYEYQWRNAETFKRGLAEIGPDNVDFVLLPYLETIGLLQLGFRPRLFRGITWATIAISIRYHHRKYGIAGRTEGSDLFQGVFLRRILRDPTLACFGAVDPFLAKAEPHPKIVHCVDPCETPAIRDRNEARDAYGIRRDTCVILVFGQIDRRKCVDVLIEGAARIVPEIDLTVFLAGVQNTEHISHILSGLAARKLREQGRLVETNRFISRDDIDPMNATDMTWVFYEAKFVASSGVLTRSARFGRPVIARRQGVIGRLVDEFDCGITLPTDNADEVAATLTMLVRDPVRRAEMGANGARCFSHNTPENFARPILDAIERTVAPR